jgi:uncharacterized membrane protein
MTFKVKKIINGILSKLKNIYIISVLYICGQIFQLLKCALKRRKWGFNFEYTVYDSIVVFRLLNFQKSES